MSWAAEAEHRRKEKEEKEVKEDLEKEMQLEAAFLMVNEEYYNRKGTVQ